MAVKALACVGMQDTLNSASKLLPASVLDS